MATKPKAVTVDFVTARPMRPPTKREPGRWYWRADAFRGGTRWHVWAGRGTRDEVRDVLLEKVRSGQAEAPADKGVEPSPTERTVERMLRRWLKAQEDRQGASLAASSFGAYRGRVNQLIRVLGPVRVAEVGKDTVTRYRDTRLHEGASTRTVFAELIAFGAAWAWARERGLLAPSPGYLPAQDFPAVVVDVKAKRDKYTPTDGEVATVLEQIPPNTWPWIALRVLHATGMRIGELAGLRWRDVFLDDERPSIYLRTSTTKTKEPRSIPIPFVVDDLRRWRPANVDLDATVLGVTPKSAVTQVENYHLPQAIEAAGLPRRFTPHGLRRAFVDTLARAGVDVKTAAALTGHSEAVMLKLYRTVSDADRHDAIERAKPGKLPRGKVLRHPKADR